MKPKMWLFSLLAALLVCNHVALSKTPPPAAVSFPTDLSGIWTFTLQREGKTRPETGIAQLSKEHGILQVELLASLSREPRITSLSLFQKGKGTYLLGNPGFQRVEMQYALLSRDIHGNSIHLVRTENDDPGLEQIARWQMEELEKKGKLLLNLIQAERFPEASKLLFELVQEKALRLIMEAVPKVTEAQLAQGMQTSVGRLFYDQLYYVLYTCWTTFLVASDEDVLPHMARILEAKKRQVVPLEKYEALRKSGKIKIFPIAFHHMFVHEYFPTRLNVGMKWDNKVFAGYRMWPYNPTNPIHKLGPVLNSASIPKIDFKPAMCEFPEFAEDVKTLPPTICAKFGRSEYGVNLDGDELIGIYYHGSGKIVYTLPLELLVAEQLQNKSETVAYFKGMMVLNTPVLLAVGAGAAVGAGVAAGMGGAEAAGVAVGVGGAEAGAAVAGAEAGAAVGAEAGAAAAGSGLRAAAATWGPRLAAIGYRADQAMTLLGSALSVMDDYRDEIERDYGERGKKFLRALDYMESAMAIYGTARVLQQTGMGPVFRRAYVDFRAQYRVAQAQRSLSKMDKQMKVVFVRLDEWEQKFLAAEQAAAKPATNPYAAGEKLTQAEEKAYSHVFGAKQPPAPVRLGEPPAGSTSAGVWGNAEAAAVASPQPLASPNVIKNNLVGQELAQVQHLEKEMQRILQQAKQNIDNATPLEKGRFWKLLQKTSTSDKKSYPMVYGSAVHEEAFGLIKLEIKSGKLDVEHILLDRGAADFNEGFIHSFGRKRPDVRIHLKSGKEIIFDFTTQKQMNHAKDYAQNSFVEYLSEIFYK